MQLIAYAINEALKSEVFDPYNPLHIRKGNDNELAEVIANLKSGTVKGLITYNVDPIYNISQGSDLATAMEKLKLSVAMSVQDNDTATVSDYAYPFLTT